MMKKWTWALTLLTLLILGGVNQLVAQPGSPGFWVRTDCTTLTGPVNDGTVCVDATTHTLRMFTSGAWVDATQTGAVKSTGSTTARALSDRFAEIVNVKDFGARCDSITDDSVALQAALTAAAGKVLFIPPGPACVFATGLTSSATTGIVGAGKWVSILRYTGSGTAWKPTNGSTGFIEVALRDIDIDLTNASAVAIDCSQMLGSTIRSVRFGWAGAGAQGGTGLSCNPNAVANSPFYNECFECYFDSLATAVKLDSQTVTSPPNRWVFIAPKVIGASGANTTVGFAIGTSSVAPVTGTSIYALDCENQGGICVQLGANADTVTLVDTTQETANGGTLFSCNAAANRTKIFGYTVKAGASGSCSGTRTVFIGAWDDIRITNSLNGSADLFTINASGSNGGVYIGLGPGAAADKGNGTINVGQGYYLNGTQVVQGNATLTPGSFTFANIGTALTVNGQIGFCSDCTIANPCAGAGTGAIAKRLNGVNVCN